MINWYWASPHEYVPDPAGPRLLDGDPIAEMRLDDPVPSRQRPYFWMHYLFYYLLKRDVEFRQSWEACTKLGAPQAHALQSLNRSRLHYAGRHPVKSRLKAIVRSISGDTALARAVHASPVQKLDWRQPFPITQIIRVQTRRVEDRRPSAIPAIRKATTTVAANPASLTSTRFQ